MTDPDPRNIAQITAIAPPARADVVRRAQLIVISGPDRGKESAIPAAGCTIGKEDDCSLRLTDSLISRRHLQVSLVDGEILLRDLGSKNGSYISGSRFLEVRVTVGAVIKLGNTELQIVDPERILALPPSTATSFGRLLGHSLKMREVFAVLERVAGTDVPILIGGETGTGKELCAEAIHQASRVGSGPFVICDIAGVARTLIENEMFGHVRGAFTGADRQHDGAFVRADRGTIFVDEIGELELELQPRLLRVLEEHQVRPIGGGSYRHVEVRIIAATNRDLREECRLGRFRHDLFHRLSVVDVYLPALRDRKEDIPFLIDSWLKPRGIEVSSEAMSALMRYEWPGNVRELRNVIARGVSLLGEGTLLEAKYLGLDRLPPGQLSGSSDYKRARAHHIEPWEREFVRALLHRNGGNVTLAAREGGLDRTYLHRLMRKYAIKPRSEDE